ncbi:MAG: DUF2182 domain-containing protein [Thaumarchaeota archaeon]|nr:DUF2182 domain-containing protein [Nitrososphaerota archaeon]
MRSKNISGEYWNSRELLLTNVQTTDMRQLKSGKTFPVLIVVGLSGFLWLVVVFASMGTQTASLNLVSLGVFMGAWAAGMAAMMLPSTFPIVSLLAQGEKTGRSDGTSGLTAADPAQFLLGYFGVWSAVGVVAFLGSNLVMEFLPPSNGVTGLVGVTSGGLVILAGVYQFSSLKQKALMKCRSPMTFILTSWRTGVVGRLLMGAEYSRFCIICCWVFMAILILVGSMSLVWMVVFAGVILVEKVFPSGLGFSKALGVLMMASGALIAGLSFI